MRENDVWSKTRQNNLVKKKYFLDVEGPASQPLTEQVLFS